eukprot:NODE_241_length_11910_cov_1.082381.p4 type:complete len:291 gc:universal NODE_241_length_11910_cov_1.082381:10193-11065(+)
MSFSFANNNSGFGTQPKTTFGQAQPQSTSGFSFGQTGQSSGFGQQPTEFGQHSSGFGGQQQNSGFGQQQNTGIGQINNQGTGFGFNNQQSNTTAFGQQNISSGFGQQNASFGSQPGFGNKSVGFGFGNTQQQSGIGFSFGQQPQQNGFQNQFTQQNQPPTNPPIVSDLLEAYGSFMDPTKSVFIHPFYNLVHPNDKQTYGKPPQVNELLYQQAQQAAPDENFVVAFALGPGDVKNRLNIQNEKFVDLENRVASIETEVGTVSKSISEYSSRIESMKRKHLNLIEKTTQVF